MRSAAPLILFATLTACGAEPDLPKATAGTAEAPTPTAPARDRAPLRAGNNVNSLGGSAASAAAAPDAAANAAEQQLDEQVRQQLAWLDPHDERDTWRLLERLGALPRADDDRQSLRVISSLVRLRKNEDGRVRRSALALLGRLPPNVVLPEIFVEAFRDGDARVRREAVVGRALQGLGDKWKPLLALVHDTDEEVRVVVATALGTVTAPEAREALCELFADPADDVVQAAATALARGITSVPPAAVVAGTASQRSRVRLAAVRVLAGCTSAESIALLGSLADDVAWDVRSEAIRAIAALGGDLAGEASTRVQTIAFDKSRTRTERFDAIQALSRTQSAPDRDKLAAVATLDPDPTLRIVAARSLLARADPRGCAALVALLDTGEGPNCDSEDAMFVRKTALSTVHEILGAQSKLPGDPAERRQLLLELDTRVHDAAFEYAPQHLAERW